LGLPLPVLLHLLDPGTSACRTRLDFQLSFHKPSHYPHISMKW
jgi:hypothetical protein